MVVGPFEIQKTMPAASGIISGNSMDSKAAELRSQVLHKKDGKGWRKTIVSAQVKRVVLGSGFTKIMKIQSLHNFHPPLKPPNQEVSQINGDFCSAIGP